MKKKIKPVLELCVKCKYVEKDTREISQGTQATQSLLTCNCDIDWTVDDDVFYCVVGAEYRFKDGVVVLQADDKFKIPVKCPYELEHIIKHDAKSSRV